MAIIYKITNVVNGKIYIGKTSSSLEERFKMHLYDSRRKDIKHRPLYLAMQKYGEDKFIPEVVETVDNIDDLDSRERYWIAKLDTYNHGYNATLGGDGTIHIDRQEVIRLHEEGYNNTQIAKELGASRSHISRVVKSLGLSSTFNPTTKEKVILSKDNTVVEFNSYIEAARFCIANKICRSNNEKSIARQIAIDKSKNRTYFGWEII